MDNAEVAADENDARGDCIDRNCLDVEGAADTYGALYMGHDQPKPIDVPLGHRPRINVPAEPHGAKDRSIARHDEPDYVVDALRLRPLRVVAIVFPQFSRPFPREDHRLFKALARDSVEPAPLIDHLGAIVLQTRQVRRIDAVRHGEQEPAGRHRLHPQHRIRAGHQILHAADHGLPATWVKDTIVDLADQVGDGLRGNRCLHRSRVRFGRVPSERAQATLRL